jgi:hypothetical protein
MTIDNTNTSKMVRYDHSSVLRGLRDDDADSIRGIMNGVMYRLNTLSSDQATMLANLSAAERALADNIYRAARDNGLMDQMVTRFASHRYASPRCVP